MDGEIYHLIDREVILDRLKSLAFGSPERIFLLKLLDDSKKIHLNGHNYLIDRLIKLNAGNEDMIKMLKKCKI